MFLADAGGFTVWFERRPMVARGSFFTPVQGSSFHEKIKSLTIRNVYCKKKT